MEYAAGKYWCVCVRALTWWFKQGAWPWRESRIAAAKCNAYEIFYAVLCVQGGTELVLCGAFMRQWTDDDWLWISAQQKLLSSFWQGYCDTFIHIHTAGEGTQYQDKVTSFKSLLQLIISNTLTLPEDSFLGSDICLQLCSSDVDADRLWQVAHGLGNHGFSCVTRLEPGCLQPHILTLVGREKCLFQQGGQDHFHNCNLSWHQTVILDFRYHYDVIWHKCCRSLIFWTYKTDHLF